MVPQDVNTVVGDAIGDEAHAFRTDLRHSPVLKGALHLRPSPDPREFGPELVNRRRLLRLPGGTGLAVTVAACASSTAPSAAPNSTAVAGRASATSKPAAPAHYSDTHRDRLA